MYVSQSTLLLLAFVVVMICDLFSYSRFTRAVRLSNRQRTDTTIFSVVVRRALAAVTREGDLFKECFQFRGSLLLAHGHSDTTH